MKQKRIYKVTTIKEDPDIMKLNSAAAHLMKSYAVEVAEASDRAYTAYKSRLEGLATAIGIYDDTILFSEIFRDDNMTMVTIYKPDGATLLGVISRREDTNE